MNITPEITAQIEGLQARERLLTKRIRWALTGIGVAAGSSVVWWLIARSQGPQSHPDHIDIPASVLALFEASANGAAYSTPFTNIAGSLGTLTGVCAFALVALGGGVVMMGGRIDALMKSIMAAIFVGVSGQLLPAFMGVEKAEVSEQEKFINAAKDHDLEGVAFMLGENKDKADARYVLAQVAVAADEASDLIAPVAQAISTGAMVAPPETSYALETAAYGAPRSAGAQQYYSDRSVHSNATKQRAGVAAGFTVLAAAIAGVGVGMLAQIRRRLSRIRALLGIPDPVATQAMANEVDSMPKPKLSDEENYRQQFFAQQSSTPSVLLPVPAAAHDASGNADARGG